MATVLRRLRLKRVSLVDSPANEDARVVLFKSAHEKQQPTSPEVHVDEMVECKKCGASVSKGASKCPKCGYEMKVQKAPERPEEDDVNEQVTATIKLADFEEVKAALAEATAKIEALTKANDELQKKLDTPEAIEKRKLDALPESIRKELETSRADIKKLKDEKAESEMVEVVKGSMQALPGKYDENGKLLKRFKDAVSPEDFDALSTMLKAASAQIEKGGLFREVGKGGDGEPIGQRPLDIIETKVAELVAKNDKLTHDDALKLIFAANPELYRAYTRSVTVGHRSADDAAAN